jgi:pimeloyl-ACP methyl ester carboxylesterase
LRAQARAHRVRGQEETRLRPGRPRNSEVHRTVGGGNDVEDGEPDTPAQHAHAPGAFDNQVKHFVDNFLEGGFAWYRATHAARMAQVRDDAPVLPKIEVPSRFYWGSPDPVILSAWMDRIPEYFADPELEIAEGTGHFVHFETPEPANKRVVEFFTAAGRP